MGCWFNGKIQDQSLLAVLDWPDKSTLFFMIIWLYVCFVLYNNNVFFMVDFKCYSMVWQVYVVWQYIVGLQQMAEKIGFE